MTLLSVPETEETASTNVFSVTCVGPTRPETGRQTTYTYDALNRLTREAVVDPNRIDRTTTWVYDAVGNRLSQDDDGVLTNYSYNANDHLLTETTGGDVTSYIYDANGNTRQKRVNGVTEATYQYDFEDRMVQADTGTQVTYTYDENGIRQSQTVDGTITDFVVDPNQTYAQVIEELDGPTGSSLVIYTHGDDLIAQQRVLEGVSGFYHYDGLGSTRMLTDPAGAVANSYVYKAFGETEDGTVLVPNLYLFTGEQFDPNVGFYYLRARYYNQGIGRFQSMDDFSGFEITPITLHKYLYASAEPVLMVDPSGRFGLITFSGANINFGSTFRLEGSRSSVIAASKFIGELAFELATGVPVVTSPRGLVSAIRSFRKSVGKLAEGPTKRLREGNLFEDAVRDVTGWPKNTRCFIDGVAVRGRPKGCRVPDFLVSDANRLFEVKKSAGAVKEAQFREFLRISEETGSPMAFIFKEKPTSGAIEKLQRWAVDELGETEDILINIVHILD